MIVSNRQLGSLSLIIKMTSQSSFSVGSLQREVPSSILTGCSSLKDGGSTRESLSMCVSADIIFIGFPSFFNHLQDL